MTTEETVRGLLAVCRYLNGGKGLRVPADLAEQLRAVGVHDGYVVAVKKRKTPRKKRKS